MSVLVKRYANRKLYNTQTSRYITLKGIAELIEAGEEVTVIDNETGEDITSIALSQILVDSERSNRTVSRTLLSDLIQRGGDALYGALSRGVDDASEGIDEVRRNVRRIVKQHVCIQDIYGTLIFMCKITEINIVFIYLHYSSFVYYPRSQVVLGNGQ